MAVKGYQSRMKSNRRLDVTEEAETDFRSLLAYSKETWGEKQRDAYAEHLSVAMHELLTHPHLGHPRDDIYPGLRSRVTQQHVIYYVVDERTVTIIRILHVRMDPLAHLRDRP
jgi:toxin ParE1/3/4